MNHFLIDPAAVSLPPTQSIDITPHMIVATVSSAHVSDAPETG